MSRIQYRYLLVDGDISDKNNSTLAISESEEEMTNLYYKLKEQVLYAERKLFIVKLEETIYE